jgi:type VI secretion system secreted protein VgrG
VAGLLAPAADGRRGAFLILGEPFDADASPGHVGQGQGQGQYRVHFEAAPAELALVPARPPRPRAPQLLTARVVGHERSILGTTRDLRLKVQFDFQRGARPNRGGLPYQPAVSTGAEATGNAPGNEFSGAWLQVLVPQAGADWGWVLPPRIGAEVLIHFLDNDIDQPVVAGVLHSGEHPPPWSAGVDSGVNHPGTLSGLIGLALDGSASQHWLHDDATGQLRMRLHSSQWGSELGLGHLIEQGVHSARRGAWRGAGFEGITQGWAVVRAGKGILLTTQIRPGTYGSAQGCQMDAAEALARLNAARELGQHLGHAAATLGAQGLRSHADCEALHRLARAIDPAQDGRHPDRVNGQDAVTPADGRAGSGQPVPAFAVPLVALDSASSLLAASGASTQLYAGQDLSLTAQGDLHHAAAHTYAQVSGQAASLYTHQGGIVAHAANGPVSVRAHTDALQLLAQQGITVSSVNDEILLYAQDKITLGGGDSSIVLDGPDITFTTTGSYTQHGGSHAFLPGAIQTLPLAPLPTQLVSELPFDFICDEVIEESYLYTNEEGIPISGINYRIDAKGKIIEGKTSAEGETDLVRVKSVGDCTQRAWHDKLSPWRSDGDA